MKLRVPFHRQRTEFTCDPASLMMALKHFYPRTKLSASMEFDIWRESFGIGIPGCMPQGLAYSARLRGLKATVICRLEAMNKVSEKIAPGENTEITNRTSAELFKKAVSLGTAIENKEPNIVDIVQAIDKGSVPLLMVNMKRLHGIDSPHWIVVTGYDKSGFFVNDPYSKRPGKISKPILEGCMDDLKELSGIEKRALIVSK